MEKRICRNEDGKGPVYCPTLHMADVVESSLSEYERPEIRSFAVNATIQEGECYVNRGKDNPPCALCSKTQDTGDHRVLA